MCICNNIKHGEEYFEYTNPEDFTTQILKFSKGYRILAVTQKEFTFPFIEYIHFCPICGRKLDEN